MAKFLIMTWVKLRWWYFHIHPGYVKIYMDEARTEAHFFHARTNSMHCNYRWIDNPTQEQT